MLGRGVIVADGASPPSAWSEAPVVVVDAAVVDRPADAVRQLHEAWSTRTPVVVDLRVDPVEFRRPSSHTEVPWSLTPDFELWHDRLHFLVWNNNYDCRTDEAIWWWGRKAVRIGGSPSEGAGDLEPSAFVAAAPGWFSG